jgi:mono/diheme cytochrome c family protein
MQHRRALDRIARFGLGWRAAAALLALALCAACSRSEQASPAAVGSTEDRPSAWDSRTPEKLGNPPEPPRAPEPEDIAKQMAPAAAKVPQEIDWTGGDPNEGRKIYELYCFTCHGAHGQGDGPGAAALDPKPRDFTSGRFYIDANANNKTGEQVDIARVIRESPGAFGGSRAMPEWKSTLSPDQVRNVVAYVEQLANDHGG